MSGMSLRPLTKLPLPLPGRIFGSPMPFGDYDPEGEALLKFKEEKISLIVLLAEEEECLRKTGRNLKALYTKEGFQVIHIPIPDFNVPSKEDLDQAVKITVEQARAGCHVAIHCHAGIGRTGLFAASLAKEVLGLSGEEAIRWTRKYIPGAVETREQRQLIMGDDTSREPH
jgi:protein-tyrosine phosphatase